MSRLVFIFAFLASATTARAADLVTVEIPPFITRDAAGELDGTHIDLISCAFKKLGEPISMTAMPWVRAKRSFMTGKFDGIFTAGAGSPTLGSVGTSSLEYEDATWSFYTLRDAPSPVAKTDPVGTMFSSGMDIRLRKMGYSNIILTTRSYSTLFSSLMSGRIKTALLFDFEAENFLIKHNLKDHFRSEVATRSNGVMYLHNNFIDRQGASYMATVDTAITDCLEQK